MKTRLFVDSMWRIDLTGRPVNPRRTAWGFALGIVAAIALAACGDEGIGPVPCETYAGGIASGALPGTYDLVSYCEAVQPNRAPPEVTGVVTITASDFTASITIDGRFGAISGTYTTNGDAINVSLSGGGALNGTFRLRNDTLALSGSVPTLGKLSVVGTRRTP